MTVKEKALYLRDEFMEHVDGTNMFESYEVGIAKKNAKQCALIAVFFAKENPLNTDGYKKYLDELEQELEKI